MIPFRVFLAGLILVAFLATLYSPPKRIVFEKTSLADESPLGHSLLYRVLSSRYRVVTTPDQLSKGPVVAVIAEPTSCSYSKLMSLLETLRAHAPRAGLVLVDKRSCAAGLSYATGIRLRPPPVRGGIALALDPYSNITVALVDVMAFYVPRSEAALLVVAPRSLATVPPWARGVPAAGVEAEAGGVRIVLITAGEAFDNRLLAAAEKLGLGNAKYIVSLVERLGGPEATVYLPREFYVTERGETPLVFHPAVLAAKAAVVLREVEEGMRRLVASSLPAALLVLSFLAGGTYVALTRAAGGGGVAAPENPRLLAPSRPLEALGLSPVLVGLSRRVGEKLNLTKDEIKAILRDLYLMLDDVLKQRLGAGVEDVLENPELLNRLSWRSPGDRELSLHALERLHTLYTRKILKGKLFPIVWSWKRELLEILEGIDPLLEALGGGLKGERGVEYVLLR